MIDREKFAMRLVELRKSRNLTQKQLAEALGTNQTRVGNWESETSLPHLDVAVALADYFNVSLDYLVGREWPKEE